MGQECQGLVDDDLELNHRFVCHLIAFRIDQCLHIFSFLYNFFLLNVSCEPGESHSSRAKSAATVVF